MYDYELDMIIEEIEAEAEIKKQRLIIEKLEGKIRDLEDVCDKLRKEGFGTKDVYRHINGYKLPLSNAYKRLSKLGNFTSKPSKGPVRAEHDFSFLEDDYEAKIIFRNGCISGFRF